jgi:hypothetical protein
MKRHIQGLHDADQSARVCDGLLLVQIQNAHHRWDSRKPFYLFRFSIREPGDLRGLCFTARLYCTAKALWKLNWLLRDFGYDSDLLDRDEVDERRLVGLRGIVKISHAVVDGTTLINLDGFAPANQWQQPPSVAGPTATGSEVAR